MLPKARRLTRSDDYARVRRIGRSRAHPFLILASATNNGETTRVGITVGKKIGSAVLRNRVKRRLRALARARIGRLRPGHDIVLIGRAETAGAPFATLRDALDHLLQRAGLLMVDDGDGGPDR